MPTIVMSKKKAILKNMLDRTAGARTVTYKGQRSNMASHRMRKQGYELVENILGNKTNFMNYYGNRERNYMLINNNGKTLLGFAYMYPPKRGKARLALIGTKPGQGYGKMLMNRIYENAKKEGKRKVVVLNAVNQARAFYRRMGYKAVAPGPNDSHNRLFYKAVSARPPQAITISSRNLNSVTPRKRVRSPNAGSATPTSKKRRTPTPST